MNRKGLLKHLVFLMFFIFIADLIAKKFYWYSTIWYFDMIMHFLGGLWLGWFFCYLFIKKQLRTEKIIWVILCVLIVGVLWEFFEFFTFNSIGHDVFNLPDTISDVFFDLCGGTFAIIYFLKNFLQKIMPINSNTV